MKRIIVILFALLPMFLNAGVIVKKSGERLEDISIKQVTDTEIVYIAANGEEISILKSDVSAILYDDGRYEEIRSNTDNTSYASAVAYGGDVREFNVYAFGNNMKLCYVQDHKHDGAVVEYRVIYKGQQEEPEWIYLGTTPFAYTTSSGGKNPMISKEAIDMAEIRPLAIENYKQVKKVEFRLSQQGYQTVVVSPLMQVDFTGFYYLISLNKLKPLTGKQEDVVVGASFVEEPVVETAKVDPYLQYQDGLIHKLSYNEFYFADSIYNKKDMQSLVITTCPAAEQYYNSAKKWVIGGWSGVGAGLAMVITGSVLTATATSPHMVYHPWFGYSYEYRTAPERIIPGIILLTVGCAGVVTSLSIACVGHHRMNNIQKAYNNSCASKQEPPLALNFGPTRNGMGMTLYF